jgi:hypothetical protein
MHCRRVSGVQRGVKGMDLDAKVASVDIVTEKQVSCVSGAPTDFEQFHEVILPSVNSQRRKNAPTHILSVDITTDWDDHQRKG